MSCWKVVADVVGRVDPMTTDDAILLVQAGLAAARTRQGGFHGRLHEDRHAVLRGAEERSHAGGQRRHVCLSPSGPVDVQQIVLALWGLPHREEKYVAIAYARAFDEWVDASSLWLFRRLVVEGAWWDLVDETAIKLVGRALLKERQVSEAEIRPWITDRRSSGCAGQR